jgi:putative ABC transport system permease protein
LLKRFAPGWRLPAAIQMLWKRPADSMLVIVNLALGIAGTTAVFSVMSAALIRSVALPEIDRLVMVWMQNRSLNYPQFYFSVPDLKDLKSRTKALEAVTPYGLGDVTLSETPYAQALICGWVGPGVLQLLGAKPHLGRLFLDEDSAPGRNSVVILSHALWQQRFGSRADLIGTSLTINRQPHTVIGVAAPGFDKPLSINIDGSIAPLKPDLWIPLDLARARIGSFDLNDRSTRALHVLARLKDGVSIDRALDDVTTVGVQLGEEHPSSNRGWQITLTSVRDQTVRGVRTPLWLLMAAVSCVLLIGCANAANLLLARAAVRGGEMTLRLALGASRGAIVASLLVEGVVYGLCAAGVGFILARVAMHSFMTLAPGNIPGLRTATLDGPVLAFAVAAAVGSAVAAALPLVHRISNPSLSGILKEGGRVISPSGKRWRDALVIIEVGGATVLLITAGLLLGSFGRLTRVDSGIQPDRVFAAGYYLPSEAYPTAEDRARFMKQLVAAVWTIQGVDATGLIDWLPFSGDEFRQAFEVQSRGGSLIGERPHANRRCVSPGYFQALGVPLHRGRLFREQDAGGATPVILVNQTLARRYFPNAEPIGRRINLEPPEEAPIWREVVGVVGDVKQTRLAEAPFPDIYLPVAQSPGEFFSLVIRTSIDQAALGASLRRTTRALDPDVAVGTITPAHQLIAASVAAERLYSTLLGVSSCVALLLAAGGVFAVMSHAVAQRTHEVGIRLALGATPSQIRALILGYAARLTIVGLLIGTAAAIIVARTISTLLFNAGLADAILFLAAPALLLLVALTATYGPARKAATVDPAAWLRRW